MMVRRGIDEMEEEAEEREEEVEEEEREEPECETGRTRNANEGVQV